MRSHSYDESFLHRDPRTALRIAEPIPRRAAEAPPAIPHSALRTNFGKNSVYIPPQSHWASTTSLTASNNKKTIQEHGAAVQLLNSNMPTPSWTAYGTESEGDIPFPKSKGRVSSISKDQAASAFRMAPSNFPPSAFPLNHRNTGSESSEKPFDEAGESRPAPRQSLLANGNHLHPLRDFRAKAAASSLNGTAKQLPILGTTGSTTSPQNGPSKELIDSPNRRFHVPPPRIIPPTKDMVLVHDSEISSNAFSHPDDTSFTNETDQMMRIPPPLPVVTQPRSSGHDAVSTLEDDDSLFDFQEDARKGRRKPHRRPSPTRRRPLRTPGDDEEDSLEQSYGAITPPATPLSATAWKTRDNSKLGAVSFGKDHSVQYYDPVHIDAVESSTTYSVNSSYTKSPESEVEDIIKDIFLIGDGRKCAPGRRKNYRPPQGKHKATLRTVDDETLETFDEDEEDSQDDTPPAVEIGVISQQDRSSAAPSEEEEEDPLASVWNFFFGPVEGENNAKEEGKSSKGQDTIQISCTPRKDDLLVPCHRNNENNGGFQVLLDYASDVLLGEPPEKSTDAGNSKETPRPLPKEETKEAELMVQQPSALTTAPSLEEDHRLVDLAIEAARSMHIVRGYEFDDSYNIDFPLDIQFAVEDLEMPLGLIFQENPLGCWITKVLPNGSASINGKVYVGDQLAAIDGISAINMKVGEIAKIIKEKKGTVELTFLRYVGPLHPVIGVVTEEGYEVKAPKTPPRNVKATRQAIPSYRDMTDSSVQSMRIQRVVKPTEEKKKRFRLFGRRSK